MPETQEKEVLLSYSGPLKYDTIGQLIHILKEKSSLMGMKLALYKKILLVMIESLENILKYNKHLKDEEEIHRKYPPEFTIEYMRNSYVLKSQNAILKSDVNELRKKLELITSLDMEGLKQLYRDTITNGQFTQKGGAGLGFIEIAKIASQKMEFEFTPIDSQYSYYNLKVIIREDQLNHSR